MSRRALVVLAACGSARHTYNVMVTGAVERSALHPPHTEVLVHTDDGAARVWLDTGVATLLGGTIALDATTALHIRGNEFVIVRGTAERRVEGIDAVTNVTVSPDGARFAFVRELPDARAGEPPSELVIVTAADASVQRIPVPVDGPARYPRTVWFAWSTPDRLVVRRGDDPPFRVELATGSVGAITETDYKVEAMVPERFECPARGFRLATRSTRQRTEIIAIPISGPVDPERLAALEPRVLVTATDYPYPYGGDGAINLGKPSATRLSLDTMLPDCSFALFTLEGRVYLLDVETGRYAFLVSGWRAEIPPMGRP